MPDDLIREAREAHDIAEQAERENRAEALLDLKFRAGEQWDEAVRRARTSEGRPTLVINRIPQFVHQVTGNVRLNPPAMLARPMGGGASADMAEVFNGIFRNIAALSDAPSVYAQAFDSAVVCGEGYFRVTTEYADADGWDQDIRLRAIPSPFGVLFDPGAVLPTREDAEHCFVEEWIPLATFKKRFPKATTTGFERGEAGPGEVGVWLKNNAVRVAEYWCKVPARKRLLRLGSGATIDATDLEDSDIAALAAQQGGVARERMVDSHKIRMHLINGVEELEAPTDWAGCLFPIVPIVGAEIHVGDRIVRHGLVRFARDAQRLYNIHRSALAESVAMAPKSKWLGTDKMFAGHEALWAKANVTNRAYLTYNPDPAQPGGPQRIAAEVPAQGLLAEIQLAAQDLEETTGIHRDLLGKQTNAHSGKAILARERQGEVGTYVYTANLEAAVTYAGRVLLDLIPKIYDNQRTVRVLGEDGSEGFVPINVQLPDGTLVNDISAGKYDVTASVGPSYATKREEMRESMMAFFQAAPQAAGITGDLLAEAMDWPDAEKIAKRLRKVLPPGLAEPEEGEAPPPPPQPGPEAIAAQANLLLAQAEQVKAQAQAQKVQSDARLAEMELQLKQAELQLEYAKLQADAGAKGGRLQLDRARAAGDLAIKRQDSQTRQVAAAVTAATSLHNAAKPDPVPAGKGGAK